MNNSSIFSLYFEFNLNTIHPQIINPANQHPNLKIYIKKDELFTYLGKQFPLQINLHQFKRSNLIFKNGKFLASIHYNLSNQQQIRIIETLFEKFYIKITKEICYKTLPLLQQVKFQNFKLISIKKLKSRWGSCSTKKNLNFSHRIAQLPPKVQYYIIVHEYCHLFEMNHSSKFWYKVSEFLPDYKELRTHLRKFEKL